MKKILVSILMLCATTCLFAGCNAVKDESFTFTNPSEYMIPHDDEITLDGNFDEAIYDTLKWRHCTYEDNATAIDIDFTAYLGDAGVTIAFKVWDPAIYYNFARASHYNSCIELYIAPGGSQKLQANAFEIDLQPSGNVVPRKYFGSFTANDARKEEGYCLKTQGIGGELYSEECEGYQLEYYMSYKMLTGKAEKPTHIDMAFALIRSYSNEVTDLNRIWALVALTDKVDLFGEPTYNWNVPETWYQFNENGLLCTNVQVNASDGGKVVAGQVLNGDDGLIKLQPDEGYRAKSVIFDGKDITNEFTVDEKGCTYQFKGTSEDKDLTVVFEKIPNTLVNLTGKITLAQQSLTEKECAALKVSAICGGVVYTGNINSSGQYMIRSVPVGEYKVVVKADDLYYPVSKLITVSETEYEADLDIPAEMFGTTKEITGLYSSGIVSGGTYEIYNYLSRGSFSDDYVIGINFKLSGINLSDSMWKEKTASCRVDLYSEDRSELIKVEILDWMGSWQLKMYIGNADSSGTWIILDEDDVNSLTSDSGFVAVFSKKGNVYSLYGVNSKGEKTSVASKTSQINFDIAYAQAARQGGATDGLFTVSNMSIINSNTADLIAKAENLAKEDSNAL